MAKIFVEEDSLVSVADSIRAKSGTEDKLTFPKGFTAAIDAIESGGGSDDIATSILDRSVTEYTDTKITGLGVACFRGCTSLTKVDMPNVTLGNGQTFYGCTNLVDVNLPKLERFTGTNTGNDFFNCTSLESISLPSLTQAATYLFGSCTKLKEVNLPIVTRIGTYAFNNCKALNKLILPELTVAEGAMLYNSGVKLVEFPKISSFTGNNHFYGCTNLTTVILSGDKVTTMQYTTTFAKSAIESGTGYIYVPSSLLESYKIATNWGKYANQIRAIEDWENRIDINTQPVDIVATVNEQITFDIVADGMGLDYQWEMSSDGGNTWSESTTNSAKTNSYVVNVRQQFDGYKVRCKVTNHEGYSVYSDVATLTVE
jgi:hypothetical protein